MVNQLQNETTFYQDGSVTVTQSRYITQSKTYAMRNISSVHVFEMKKSKVPSILILLSGILIIFLGIFWIELVLIILGILMFFFIKNEYSVRISTNAGESNSIISKNKEYIKKIVNALNDAIVHRG